MHSGIYSFRWNGRKQVCNGKYRMRLIRTHMDYITAEINDIDSSIEKMISSNPDYENAVRLLCTIPGVKRDSAIAIISEIGTGSQ